VGATGAPVAPAPRLLHTVLDGPDVRRLAEFYRRLLGLHYRPGDEPPAQGTADDADWLVLTEADGTRRLAFQLEPELTPTTWPRPDVPMQLHLDMTVPDRAALERQRERAEALGATLLADRTDDADEPLYVLADPAGHPFCLFVG
jgi:catechol 2,3-dioxygenase-like lactoylglutathione lyase family enzyme